MRQTEILECFIDNYASIICVSFVILWTPIYDDCRCEFAAPFSNHFIAMILWCQSKSYTHLKMYDCDSVMIFIVYTFQAIQFKHFQTGQRMKFSSSNGIQHDLWLIFDHEWAKTFYNDGWWASVRFFLLLLLNSILRCNHNHFLMANRRGLFNFATQMGYWSARRSIWMSIDDRRLNESVHKIEHFELPTHKHINYNNCAFVMLNHIITKHPFAPSIRFCLSNTNFAVLWYLFICIWR